MVSSKYAADSPWGDTRSQESWFLEINALEKANWVSRRDLLPWGRGWSDK